MSRVRPHCACLRVCQLVRRPRATIIVKPPFTSFFSHNNQWEKHPEQSSTAGRTFPISSAIPEHIDAPQISSYSLAKGPTLPQLVKLYAQLSKSRLSTPVVLTAMSAVALSPLTTTVSILLSTAIGTALCIASANTLNQLQEIPFDAQMARTRMRPLVRRAITPVHAAGFALVTGIAGPTVLWTMLNPTTAALGAANIALYAGLYTWLKRKSVFNTWVGAVVGAIPPLMGWTACGGQLFPSVNYPVEFFLPPFLSLTSAVDITMINNPLAPLAFFMLLFSWQFPHFNSLSHLVRGSYAQAGYPMLSVLSPPHNALVALRHAIILIPVCSALIPLSGLTTWTFAVSTLVPNAVFVRAAWRFWRNRREKYARAVFQHSLWYLPMILGLMMVHKQGMDWREWLGLLGFGMNDYEQKKKNGDAALDQ